MSFRVGGLGFRVSGSGFDLEGVLGVGGVVSRKLPFLLTGRYITSKYFLFVFCITRKPRLE